MLAGLNHEFLRNCNDVLGAGIGGEREEKKTRLSQPIHRLRPRAEPGEWNGQGMPDRNTYGLAIERIGAAGREQDGRGRPGEGSGIAENGAKVVVVDEVLKDDKYGRRGENPVNGRLVSPNADGQQAAMDVEPDDAVHGLLVDDENGSILGQGVDDVADAVQPHRRREN